MDGFSGDPVGRCLLKELVLWMLAERRRAGRKESTSCPDNG